MASDNSVMRWSKTSGCKMPTYLSNSGGGKESFVHTPGQTPINLPVNNFINIRQANAVTSYPTTRVLSSPENKLRRTIRFPSAEPVFVPHPYYFVQVKPNSDNSAKPMYSVVPQGMPYCPSKNMMYTWRNVQSVGMMPHNGHSDIGHSMDKAYYKQLMPTRYESYDNRKFRIPTSEISYTVNNHPKPFPFVQGHQGLNPMISKLQPNVKVSPSRDKPQIGVDFLKVVGVHSLAGESSMKVAAKREAIQDDSTQLKRFKQELKDDDEAAKGFVAIKQEPASPEKSVESENFSGDKHTKDGSKVLCLDIKSKEDLFKFISIKEKLNDGSKETANGEQSELRTSVKRLVERLLRDRSHTIQISESVTLSVQKTTEKGINEFGNHLGRDTLLVHKAKNEIVDNFEPCKEELTNLFGKKELEPKSCCHCNVLFSDPSSLKAHISRKHPPLTDWQSDNIYGIPVVDRSKDLSQLGVVGIVPLSQFNQMKLQLRSVSM